MYLAKWTIARSFQQRPQGSGILKLKKLFLSVENLMAYRRNRTPGRGFMNTRQNQIASTGWQGIIQSDAVPENEVFQVRNLQPCSTSSGYFAPERLHRFRPTSAQGIPIIWHCF